MQVIRCRAYLTMAYGKNEFVLFSFPLQRLKPLLSNDNPHSEGCIWIKQSTTRLFVELSKKSCYLHILYETPSIQSIKYSHAKFEMFNSCLVRWVTEPCYIITVHRLTYSNDNNKEPHIQVVTPTPSTLNETHFSFDEHIWIPCWHCHYISISICDLWSHTQYTGSTWYWNKLIFFYFEFGGMFVFLFLPILVQGQDKRQIWSANNFFFQICHLHFLITKLLEIWTIFVICQIVF